MSVVAEVVPRYIVVRPAGARLELGRSRAGITATKGCELNAKYAIGLFLALCAVWFLWSGHTEPFMLGLGAVSCLLVVGLCWRMEIVDEEAVPLGLGIRPMAGYLPWLVKEIVVANWDVTRRILAKDMPIWPQMIEVRPKQRTEMGRVIYANSITLTPGTVSVDMQEDRIRVHALSAAEAEEDMSGEMDRRVCALEPRDSARARGA